MHKLGALFHNEIIKSRKKVSIYIIVIVMTVGMIGCSTFIKSTEYQDVIEDSAAASYEENLKYAEELENRIRECEEALADEALSPNEASELKEQLHNLELEYIYYDIYGNYAKEQNIGNLSYRYGILEDLVAARQSLLDMEYSGVSSSSEEYQALLEQLNELDAAIKQNDYRQYIQDQIEWIEQDPAMSDAQKDAAISYNNALLGVCPTGEYASYREKSNAESLLNQKASIEASLQNNVDLEKGGNLTPERRSVLEKNLKLTEAKIQKGFLQDDPDNTTAGGAYTVASSLGMVFSVVILIILAGSMMSHEMSTGTIKSLIIAPVKRWKIYLAKYLSMLAVMLVLILYTYAVASLTNGLLFGFRSFGEKVFLVSGEAVTLNYFLYQLFSALCSIVPFLVFTTFAYTLSIVTKNTAASVSVSMGLYLGGSFLHLLLVSNLAGYGYLIRFLPFSNLSFFEKIFYSSSPGGTMGGMLFGGISETASTPLVFSIFYIIIILVCMISVGLVHFCRRDIK